MQAQQALTLNTTTLDNRAGNIAGNAALTLNLLGAFANAKGQLASMGPLLLQGATQIDNQNGQIVSQGLLTLLAGTLDNRNSGVVAANGALLLTATGAVQNDSDGLIFSRDAGVRIQSANLGNGLGAIQAKGDLAIATGAFSNLGGRVISQAGNLDISADNLDNRGGTLASLEGWVKARLSGWLDNGQGGVVQGQSLDLTAAAVTNRGGYLSALSGNALLGVANLDNSQGALFAKQLLKVNGNSLTNAGQIAAGTVDFSLAGALNNQGGIIESDSSLTLAAASLVNRGGQLRALGTGGRTQLSVQGLLDNRNGTLETANLDFGLAAGSLQNAGGTLLHVGSGAFDIALPNVANAGGSIVTNGGLTLTADSWTNSAIIQARRLTVDVGRFIQTASGQLLASSVFTGSGGDWRNDGLIASDGVLSLALGGTYSGSGRVSSLGDLGLSAAQLSLPTAGRITGGGSTNVWVGGLLSNSGVMTSASGLTVNAGQLNNFGTLGSAEQLRLVTPNLLNANGLIFSGGDMALRVGSFTNRYADVYSLGALDIAANDAGAYSTLLDNVSATLESARDMRLAASSIINRKEAFQLGRELVSSVVALTCNRCRGNTWDISFVAKEQYQSTILVDSAASLMSAGGNLVVASETFQNLQSLVSSGGNLDITTGVFSNQGAAAGSIDRTRVYNTGGVTNGTASRLIIDVLLPFNQRNDPDFPGLRIADASGQMHIVLPEVKKIGKDDPPAAYYSFLDVIGRTVNLYTNYPVYKDQVLAPPSQFDPDRHEPLPSEITQWRLESDTEISLSTGVAAQATIQAAGSVRIQAGERLENGVIAPSQQHIAGVNRVGATSADGAGAATSIVINGQLPPDLAQQQVNPLAQPGFSIPSGPNGLFRLSSTEASNAQADQAAQGPQSWTLGGASIGQAEREQDRTDTRARQVQVNDAGQTIIGGRQLELGDRLQAEGAGIGAIQVEAGDAPSGFVVPDRSGAAGKPGQGGGIPTEQASDGTDPLGQSIVRVQGLPANQAPPKPHKYLVETNPALTNLKQFLSSDYLLGRLGYDPDQAQKRLGDGLYEQRLVREAIAARTGQRFLAGLDSDEAMFRYLMDNALASKQQLNLSLGVSLSASQVAALTHDIVWMEQHVVNGETVLVPVLYLAQAKGRLAPTGALIQGKDVTLISGGELANQGTLRASDNLSATGKNLVNSGLIEAGNRLDLLATDSIRNAQGGIIAGRDVSAIALTGDIINERTSTRVQVDTGSRTGQRDYLDSAARIEAANNLSLGAGRDIANIGSVLQAGGDLFLNAGRDVQILSQQERIGQAFGAGYRDESTTQRGSTLTSGRDLIIEAGRDITAIASQLEARRDIRMDADRDILLASAANEEHFYAKSKTVTRQEDHVRQQETSLLAGGDVDLQAGKDLTLLASRIEAGDEAFLYAGNDLSLLAAEDSDYSLYEKKKKGSFGSSSFKRDEVTDVRNIGSSITTGSDLTLVSEGDQRYQKAKLESGADLTLDSGGEIAFEAVKDLHQESHEKSKGDLAWTSAKGKGTTDETVRQSELIAQGEIAIKAVDGLKVDLKHIDQQTVSQTIDAMVQADPSLAWIQELEQRGDVDWRRVKEVHESFKYSHSGIGAGAAIAIAILVAVATYGAASGMVGSAAGAAAGSGTAMAAGTATTTTVAGVATTSTVAAGWGNAMAATALSSAAGTGAASLVSNRGDLGETLKDVTSKDSLKAYATAALIAGFGAGVTDGWGRELTAEGNYKIDYAGRLKAYMANTALKGMLSGENKEAWLSIAATGALMELYKYSVGREPDIRPGVERPSGSNFDDSSGIVPQVNVGGYLHEGKNIGLNLPMTDSACAGFYSICHGTAVSNMLNEIPGFNAFATLHDQWMISLEKAKGADMTVFENIGSMPPAIFVNYGAIYEKYRPAIEGLRDASAKKRNQK